MVVFWIYETQCILSCDEIIEYIRTIGVGSILCITMLHGVKFEWQNLAT